jgi:hypothetical protein
MFLFRPEGKIPIAAPTLGIANADAEARVSE